MADGDSPRAYAFSVTPFDANGELDEEVLRAHLRRLRDAGVGVYLAGSGGGEVYSLSTREQQRMFEIGVEELKGHVPVYAASFEPRNAAQLLEYADIAVKAGVDAVQLYPVEGGHGMVPTGRELQAYFDELITQIDAPIILAPHYKLGYKMEVAHVDDIIRRHEGRVIGVNFVQTDPNYLIDMHDTFGDRVRICSGGTKWAITNLGLGGWGFNSSETNVMPRTAMAVVQSFKQGDAARAVQAHTMMLRLTRVFEHLMPTTPRPMKTILQLLGLPGGYLRKPYLTPEGAELERMHGALKAFDVLAIERQFSTPEA